jgi:hypothetical protein
MKVALLFSGQPRNISEKTFSSFEEQLLSKYDVDVYAHFWYDSATGSIGDSYAPWLPKHYLKNDAQIPELFQSLYKPKSMLLDAPLPFKPEYAEYTRVAFKNAAYNNFSLYTSLRRTFQSIPNPNDYDLLIRSRTDLQIDKLPALEECLSSIHVKKILSWGAIENNFWIAPPALAADVYNAVDTIDLLYKKGVKLNDEEIFYETLAHWNLLGKTVENKIDFHICRD